MVRVRNEAVTKVGALVLKEIAGIKSKEAWPLASLSVARGLFWFEGVLEF